MFIWNYLTLYNQQQFIWVYFICLKGKTWLIFWKFLSAGNYRLTYVMQYYFLSFGNFSWEVSLLFVVIWVFLTPVFLLSSFLFQRKRNFFSFFYCTKIVAVLDYYLVDFLIFAKPVYWLKKSAYPSLLLNLLNQQTIACSSSIKETLEKGVEYV